MQRIQNHIKENQFQQIYLLYGEEHYLKQQYTEKLRRALSGDDTMNTHFYQGKDCSVGEIIDLAETMPFMAQRRVIFLKNTGLFKSGGEALAQYLASPNETTCFVFTENEVDKRSKLFKQVSSAGCAVEFSTQDESTLKRWIASILAKEGKRITENTAALFLSKTGTDMQNIQMELEKLISYCLERDVVTDRDVEEICTTRMANHIFDMVECIARRQTREALAHYYELLALKEQPLGILAMIARHCNHLLQTKELKNRGFGEKDIAAKVGIPPFVAKKYVAQASKFKATDLRRALEQCVEAEAAVKSGRANDKMSVEILIVSVLQPAG